MSGYEQTGGKWTATSDKRQFVILTRHWRDSRYRRMVPAKLFNIILFYLFYLFNISDKGPEGH